MENFFDEFNNFYTTSKTGATSNRLNRRYAALIEYNRTIISNSSILDIASHDGRWAFAAIKNNSKFVLGIEARKHLVDNAVKTFRKYEIPKKKYNFVIGDINSEIKKIKPRKFDVVFCFGFFYHTLNHFMLLSEIKRIQPKYLILDTGIAALYNEPIILLNQEDPDDERMAIREQFDKKRMVIVGLPSKSALEMLLQNFGFEYSYFDWHKQGIKDWENIEDYQNNTRVSIIARNKEMIC